MGAQETTITRTDDVACEDGGSVGDVLELLSNQRRRYLWQHLHRHDGEVALRDASRSVAARENDIAIESVTYDQRKSVYTSLIQFHCPKMADAGLLQFDKRKATAAVTPETSSGLVVEVTPGADEKRQTVFGSIGLASLIVVGSWRLGLPVFGRLSLDVVLLSLAISLVPAVLVYYHLAHNGYGVNLAEVLTRARE